jgi:hypothetical protein
VGGRGLNAQEREATLRPISFSSAYPGDESIRFVAMELGRDPPGAHSPRARSGSSGSRTRAPRGRPIVRVS